MTTWAERAERREEFERENHVKAITELDYALNCAAIEIDTTNARAELAALRASLATAQATIAQQVERIAALERDVETARNALTFYSLTENYKGMTPSIDVTPVDIDSGERAKNWLTKHTAPVTEHDADMLDEWHERL